MTGIISALLTVGVGYLLGHWDEINWKLTKPPEGYEWDARKMVIDSSKGISERKNSKEFYRRCNSGQYFKKKEK